MGGATHLHFHSTIGQQKPESIVNRAAKCPFCDRDSLTDILAVDGPMILLKNKYPVLQDTLMTVLIETDDCDAEFTTYEREHLHRLFRFGVSKWLEMEASGEYESVLFFKSHGPLSGGTIHHPHMQIIGLKDVQYRDNVSPEHFEGVIVAEEPGVELNISTKPRAGFFEFNVVLRDRAKLLRMADFVQTAAHYVLHYFHKSCNSYNVFFYQLNGDIMVKIMPRFVTSPLFIGFSIPGVSDRIHAVAGEMKQRYFQNGEEC